jgi:hypothetical protein
MLFPYGAALRMLVGFSRKVCGYNIGGDRGFAKFYPRPSTKSCWVIPFITDEVADTSYAHDSRSPHLISVEIFM